MNIKKNILIFLFAILTAINLFAETDIWVGTGFYYLEYFPDATEKPNYSVTNGQGELIINPDTLIKMNYLGPSLDLTVYPVSTIPVGLSLCNQVLFPIGQNNDKYTSYHFDLKNRTTLNVSYAQSFSETLGLFADLGFVYDYHRIAKTNIWNSKAKPEYNTFDNYGIHGDLGFLTRIDNGYFKFGFDFYHSLKNSAKSYNLIFAGGYSF